MPINVAHNPDARLVAAAAYQGGLGQYRARMEEMAQRQAMQQQQIQAQQQSQQFERAANLERMAAQNLYGRQQNQQEMTGRMAMGEAEAGREAAANEARFGQQKELAGLEFDQRLGMAREGQKLDLENWDYQFSAKQKADISRITNGIDWVKNSDLRPEEKDWAMRQLEGKLSGFEPLPMPKPGEKPVDMGKVVQERTFKGPDGATFMMQPDGKLEYRPPPKASKPPADPNAPPPSPSFEEFNKQINEVTKAMVTTRPGSTEQVHPDPKSVLDEFDRRQEAYNARYRKPAGQGQQQGGPPMPPGGPGAGGPVGPSGMPGPAAQQPFLPPSPMAQPGPQLPPGTDPAIGEHMMKIGQHKPIPINSETEWNWMGEGAVYVRDGKIRIKRSQQAR